MKHVYVISSLSEETTLIFGTLKRASSWLTRHSSNYAFKRIFDRSSFSDLYITDRVVF